jgi:hypothetical protein
MRESPPPPPGALAWHHSRLAGRLNLLLTSDAWERDPSGIAYRVKRAKLHELEREWGGDPLSVSGTLKQAVEVARRVRRAGKLLAMQEAARPARRSRGSPGKHWRKRYVETLWAFWRATPAGLHVRPPKVPKPFVDFVTTINDCQPNPKFFRSLRSIEDALETAAASLWASESPDWTPNKSEQP